jgi:signal transduction histidine kinase
MTDPVIINALLVEDNPGDARLAQEAFRECESGIFRVTHVETLSDALEHLHAMECDVVLLDLSLPDAKGLSAVSRLRTVNPEVPVVILTGLNDEELAIDALQEGAQDYLVKGSETFHYVDRAVRHAIERQKIERLLAASLEEAKQASRAKSEFLATMSHELRTPLNAIIGFSEIMNQELLGALGNPSYAEYSGSIHESGMHLLGIINDILDLAKIETGGIELRKDWISLSEVLEAGSRMVEQRATDGDVTLVADDTSQMPRLMVDRMRFLQIIVNLMSNAVKFTPEGGSVTIGGRLDSENTLEIYVVDTGIGIAPEDIETALTPFRQVDGALNRKFEGTGLGLPLTKQLAELQGGELILTSEVGVGTSVLVRFPAKAIEDINEDRLAG